MIVSIFILPLTACSLDLILSKKVLNLTLPKASKSLICSSGFLKVFCLDFSGDQFCKVVPFTVIPFVDSDVYTDNFLVFVLNNHTCSAPTRSNAFADVIYEIGQEDSRICALVADISPAGSIVKFREKFPERFINTGVAEQAMIGIAAGLALKGMRPLLPSACIVPSR